MTTAMKPADAFISVARLIPLQKRLQKSAEFDILLDHFKLSKVLLQDQRKAREDLGGTTHWAHKRNNQRDYFVEFRGIEGGGFMNLEEAAKYVGLTPKSLRQTVAVKKVYSAFMSEPNTRTEDLVTVVRLKQPENSFSDPGTAPPPAAPPA